MSLHYSIDPFTEDLKDLENRVIQAYGKIQTFSLEARNYIQKLARASMIGGSTRIENAQLTDLEVVWLDTILSTDGREDALEENRFLIETKLSKDRQRSYEEVAGCRDMLNSIFDDGQEMFPLRETDIRGLHSKLMAPYQGSGPYVGQYKVQPNYVVSYNQKTKESRIIFQTAEAGPITQAAMSDLVVWYNSEMGSFLSPIAIACEFVFRFLAIHPFQDGNGRLGRGLFLLCLLQSRHQAIREVLPYIAIDRHMEKYKQEYYSTLNRCSQGVFRQDPCAYQIGFFLRFMMKMINESLEDIDLYHERFLNIQKLSPSAYQVYECFKNYPELRLTTQKIYEITGLPKRTIVSNLAQLLVFNLIQRYGQGAGTHYQMTF